MHVHDRRRSRWLTATVATMAVALPGSVLALTQAPASAEPCLRPTPPMRTGTSSASTSTC